MESADPQQGRYVGDHTVPGNTTTFHPRKLVLVDLARPEAWGDAQAQSVERHSGVGILVTARVDTSQREVREGPECLGWDQPPRKLKGAFTAWSLVRIG